MNAGFEYIVTLHFIDGTVCRTAYARNKQTEAIACWQRYIEEGKIASLSIE